MLLEHGGQLPNDCLLPGVPFCRALPLLGLAPQHCHGAARAGEVCPQPLGSLQRLPELRGLPLERRALLGALGGRRLGLGLGDGLEERGEDAGIVADYHRHNVRDLPSVNLSGVGLHELPDLPLVCGVQGQALNEDGVVIGIYLRGVHLHFDTALPRHHHHRRSGGGHGRQQGAKAWNPATAAMKSQVRRRQVAEADERPVLFGNGPILQVVPIPRAIQKECR
mmetsp:Transcript_141341/g.439297  ORF Transcript_141341/g.439297 Transcript_141341/m.439297 type:complete len:223 (+) Transcript_141341:2174-2842(+)